MASLKVIQPGIFSLLQDSGRFGHHSIGLTTGGPLDRQSFRWANQLCGNTNYGNNGHGNNAKASDSDSDSDSDKKNTTVIEVTIGGLVLEANSNTSIALTGADIPLSINKKPVALWQTHRIKKGDRIDLGFAQSGCRGYLAVAGGFQGQPIFNSQSTVPRESLGGLNQDGKPLQAGDHLPYSEIEPPTLQRLEESQRPSLSRTNTAHLRVVLGYQQDAFSALQKQVFFASEYLVTENADRMGCRLNGPAIKPSLEGILSEGICLGAIQIPADGQPIILLADRQTIGGYPKIGSVLSLDLGKLAQLTPGGKVSFEPIGIEQAHNLLLLDEQQFQNTQLVSLADTKADHA